MTRRRVDKDVGEIEIEGNKDPSLPLRSVKDSWIGVAAQLLVEDGMHIVTSLLKQGIRVTRKILVKFEPSRHPARSGRDGNDTLSRQVRGVADSCGNMFRPK